MPPTDFDPWYMRRALELAQSGRGYVEPNPLVGCVIVQDGEVVGEGFHQRFGGPHAEIEALQVAGSRARGATLYVTLEPCCHHGKTPPCTGAIIRSGVARVVAAMTDPFSQVAGKGLSELQAAGIETEVGLHEAEARELNAPYLKLIAAGRPWVIAKWAMTLDGRIATRDDDSRWISSDASRALVHQMRGRVDAIVVGRRTAEIDDPLLTARPSGPRIATRVVLDSRASLPSESQLVRTAQEAPLLVAVSADAPAAQRQRLEAAGCEVFVSAGNTRESRLESLLDELGRRRLTNVLVEGGSELLGSLFDASAVDEVHVFVAPKLVGGEAARPPLGGIGRGTIAEALALRDPQIAQVGGDVYIHGRVLRPAAASAPLP